MWFRKKKPKVKAHSLRWIGLKQLNYYRPMRCIDCEKTYIMDVFGGWGIEYNFTIDNRSVIERIEDQDIEKAIMQMHKIGSRNWLRVDSMACEKI